ncbi:hypothetical protein QLX08_009838 [Tetragonisca angustula]|uniref:Uncharacterized protein n=1 Tax=Tetragonisca angustula TaxID=166442 RepID=A0AAW0ZEK6_9HYME
MLSSEKFFLKIALLNKYSTRPTNTGISRYKIVEMEKRIDFLQRGFTFLQHSLQLRAIANISWRLETTSKRLQNDFKTTRNGLRKEERAVAPSRLAPKSVKFDREEKVNKIGDKGPPHRPKRLTR